jgi:hypothetical protein
LNTPNQKLEHMEQETSAKHKIEEQDYTKVPKGKFKSVKDIGFVEETNSRYRRTMEVRIFL